MSEQELTEQFEPEEVLEEVVEPVEPEAPRTYEFEGRELTPEQVQIALNFNEYVEAHPQEYQDLLEWQQGRKVLVDPNEFQQQNDEEYEEPEEEFVDDEYEQMRSEMAEMAQRIESLGQDYGTRVEMERRNALLAGVNGFRQEHEDLSQADMERVFLKTRDSGLIQSYLQRDPYNPSEAVKYALEDAYKLEFWNRAGAQQYVTDQRTRRRAASVGTNGGSVTRAEPQPTTPQERQAAITKEIADAMAAD